MTNKSKSLVVPFIAVTTLFFAWGFITQMIDPLVASVKAVFSLSNTESMLTQFAYFMAYGVVSLPAAALVARAGYGRAIAIALAAMIVGCLVIPLATQLGTYELVLVALFIIASGVTVLQVAANPLVAGLGPPKWSHLRLLFSQAFNSVGTVLAPYIGSAIMLSGGVFAAQDGAVVEAARRTESLRSIDTAFFVVVGLIVLLVVLIVASRKRIEAAAPALAQSHETSILPALRSRWAVLGAIAIFLYVGSEVTIGSLLTNFLHQEDILNVSLERAGKLVSFYWMGAMVGRFIGSVLLLKVPAYRLLTLFTLVAAALCLTVTQSGGEVAAYAAIAVGLFNSIMFPVIFTLTLERSTASQAATSGLLCMAITGGAILPLLGGVISDEANRSMAFFVPACGYIALFVFALVAGRAGVAAANRPAASTAH
ncbi:MAG: sugar MFS transporter [Gammaproteobacteria bacterium]